MEGLNFVLLSIDERGFSKELLDTNDMGGPSEGTEGLEWTEGVGFGNWDGCCCRGLAMALAISERLTWQSR